MFLKSQTFLEVLNFINIEKKLDIHEHSSYCSMPTSSKETIKCFSLRRQNFKTILKNVVVAV